ncbi:redoxin domain-containing protein [Candidatus Poribacteria bacterium]|nr:redoxin domain-containing protein [Candidatus Poribacteria bacterium]
MMLILRQKKLSMSLKSVLVLFTVFCVSISNAQQVGSGASASLKKLDIRTMDETYKEISSTAVLGFMKHLTDPNDTEALEKLVTLSDDFIKKYPSSERIGEVHYYYGKALMQLGQVEKGISILEKLIANVSHDYFAVTRYSDGSGDALRWKPYERGLLELGLAYDKQKAHDKADTVYKKLLTHPDYAVGLPAQIARKILETDLSSRTGEVKKFHNAWIGLTTPNFRMQQGTDRHQRVSLNQYEGQIVLLYYDKTDTPNPNLKKIHDRYKDQKFQIISVNPDASENPIVKPVEPKGDVWMHSWDTHGKIADMYQIRTLPALFLLDSDGVVQETQSDVESLDKAIDELVKENLATYDNQKTEAIVAKAVKTHGGFEKLQAVKNFAMNVRHFEYFPDGTSEIEGYGRLYYYKDKLRTEFRTDEGERYIRLFDGTSLYASEDDKLQQVPHEEAKFTINRVKDTVFSEPIWLLIKLAQNEIPIQYVGTKNVNGVPTSVLRVRQPSGKPLKIFISEKTHLFVQFVISDGRVDTVQSFKQYKEVDGIKTAHQIIFKNESHNETYYTNITLNADIDLKLFNPKK